MNFIAVHWLKNLITHVLIAHWKVHKIQVDIIKAEGFQLLFAYAAHVSRVMVRIPELYMEKDK